jgi:hypothetical protein
MKEIIIQIPDSVYDRIIRQAEKESKDEGALINELLMKGLRRYLEERLPQDLALGQISDDELCSLMGLDQWEVLKHLEQKQLVRPITLRDWLDSFSMH